MSIVLFSSASSGAGTGSVLSMPEWKSTSLAVQVVSGSYSSVQIYGGMDAATKFLLPAYSTTGSITTPLITTLTPGLYVFPNVGGLNVEARVNVNAGTGSVLAAVLTT